MRLPGAQLSALNSTLPTIRNGEPTRNLQQWFVKETARPHNGANPVSQALVMETARV
jgi:hypothetical protein